MAHQQPVNPEKLDELLSALANYHGRATVAYLRDEPEDVATVRDIATEISNQDHGGRKQVTLQLQHSTLPKLAAAGVIEYDARSDVVRYHGSSRLEALMECLVER